MGGSPVSHQRVEGDARVADPGATYHGGALKASDDEAAVTVYDGIDDSADDMIDFFYGGKHTGDHHWLGEGIAVRRGLYVDLGSSVDEFTIYYEPAPRAKG